MLILPPTVWASWAAAVNQLSSVAFCSTRKPLKVVIEWAPQNMPNYWQANTKWITNCNGHFSPFMSRLVLPSAGNFLQICLPRRWVFGVTLTHMMGKKEEIYTALLYLEMRI